MPLGWPEGKYTKLIPKNKFILIKFTDFGTTERILEHRAGCCRRRRRNAMMQAGGAQQMPSVSAMVTMWQ